MMGQSKIKLIILIVVFVIIVVAALFGGYHWGFNAGKRAATKAGAPVVNPFDAVKTNPLEGQGYANPFEGIRINPFK